MFTDIFPISSPGIRSRCLHLDISPSTVVNFWYYVVFCWYGMMLTGRPVSMMNFFFFIFVSFYFDTVMVGIVKPYSLYLCYMADFVEFTFTLFFLPFPYSLPILVRCFLVWCGIPWKCVQFSNSCCMSWSLGAFMLGSVLFSTAPAVHRLFCVMYVLYFVLV